MPGRKPLENEIQFYRNRLDEALIKADDGDQDGASFDRHNQVVLERGRDLARALKRSKTIELANASMRSPRRT